MSESSDRFEFITSLADIKSCSIRFIKTLITPSSVVNMAKTPLYPMLIKFRPSVRKKKTHSVVTHHFQIISHKISNYQGFLAA